ncbi:putative (S)-norcoclaurine synthase [Helianthus annuus]|nr:putative (S)-norcoclaurine synthase [Helianthus annuus]
MDHNPNGFPYYKEKFTKVDNENMIKETEVVEGGFLDVGFTLYRIRFEIKENPNDDTGLILSSETNNRVRC